MFDFGGPSLPPPPKATQLAKCWTKGADRDKGIKDDVVNPSDVAFLGDSAIVVADSEGHRLCIYDLEGNLRSTIAEEKVWPNCVACTRDGKIICTDRQSRRTKIYDVTGKCVGIIGSELWEGEFEIDLRPHGVAVDSAGQIIVTDTQLHKVQVYAGDGSKLREFGGKGQRVGQLLCPFYATVDSRDNIVVSDNMNYAIKKFDTNGNYLMKIGSGQDWGQRKFQSPYGVAVDSYGQTLVADYEGNRISIYTPDGEPIGDVVSKRYCRSPCGVALNDKGELLITENNLEYSNIKAFTLEYQDDLHY